MASNDDLEKRIENLEKEVKHLKAVLQYQIRNKKKWKAYHLYLPYINKNTWNFNYWEKYTLWLLSLSLEDK